MIEETYKFKWKTFEEEMPESYKMILARSPKKQMNDIQWYFLTSDKKQLHLHDLKCEYYISRIKKWLWCYPEDIEKIEENNESI
jgi:hypothetical protein